MHKRSIILVMLIIILASLAPVTYADPRPSLKSSIAAESYDKIIFSGSTEKITVSFNVYIPTQYGTFTLHINDEHNISNKASIIAESAIGIVYGSYSNKLYGANGNSILDAVSSEGYTCSHYVVVTNIDKPGLKITRTFYGYRLTYKYIIYGYYQKTGWGCFDEKKPFMLDASSSAIWLSNG
ncbi:MAG: hypothetical protein LRS47_00375 [Desulfurococcales archaeon]|nr:hypothetical protein [Desulfurococcales archaeon]